MLLVIKCLEASKSYYVVFDDNLDEVEIEVTAGRTWLPDVTKTIERILANSWEVRNWQQLEQNPQWIRESQFVTYDLRFQPLVICGSICRIGGSLMAGRKELVREPNGTYFLLLILAFRMDVIGHQVPWSEQELLCCLWR